MTGIVVQKKRLLEDSFDITPSGLQFCFDRELFLRDEFNVDKFVMRQKKVVSLEILREDLMQYFNILKNSLVELINQDYADFVNLSTNLVGLDKVIGTIEVPMEKEKHNIINVRKVINETLEEINKRKHSLKLLQEKRELITFIENVLRYVELLENRLGISNTNNSVENKVNNAAIVETPLDKDIGQKLEVIGYEFTQLEYFTEKCAKHNIIENLKQRISDITLALQSQLEMHFIKNVREKNEKSLQQVLRTYLTINKAFVAEQLYRECFVQPELERLISIKKYPEQDLSLFYNEIMVIVDNLLNVLYGLLTDNTNKYEVVKDFDFLVNSIFAEIVNFIIKTAPQIFSPGNPDLFYQRYSCTMAFIDSFEEKCSDLNQLKNLRNSNPYKEFNNKWSVAVYFQIRYQEITLSVNQESCNEEIVLRRSGSYNYGMIDIIHKSLTRCWQLGIYLDPLRHRFWKLNLQLINFLVNYIKNIQSDKVIINGDSKFEDETCKISKQINAKTLLLVDLYRFMDIKTLAEKSVSDNEGLVWIYHKHLLPTLAKSLNDKETLCIQEALNDCTIKIIGIMYDVISNVQSTLVDQCVQSIKAVFDIPRQYRRTNRPWPNVASNYVNNIFKPILQFLTDNQEVVEVGNLKIEILKNVIVNITHNYQEQIKELLNSIKKMEDSLKMFKRTRINNTDQLISDKNSVSASDDDKIRRQVTIDVKEFCAKCCQILNCCPDDSLHELVGLSDLVGEMCSVTDN